MKRFKDERTENLYWGHAGKGIPADVALWAHSKIKFVAHAASLKDIGLLPSAKLEKLVGKRKGQYSIRVNSQWRICFMWDEGRAAQIEFVDYHK